MGSLLNRLWAVLPVGSPQTHQSEVHTHGHILPSLPRAKLKLGRLKDAFLKVSAVISGSQPHKPGLTRNRMKGLSGIQADQSHLGQKKQSASLLGFSQHTGGLIICRPPCQGGSPCRIRRAVCVCCNAGVKLKASSNRIADEAAQCCAPISCYNLFSDLTLQQQKKIWSHWISQSTTQLPV